MKREEKLAKNLVLLAFGTFFPKLATFISLPILTGYLSQADYGIYELVLTLVALILPATTLQIHSAAFRFLIDVQHDEDEKRAIITNIYAFVIPTSLITLAAMFFILHTWTVPVRIAVCAYFFFDILVNANRQVIRGLGRNKDYAISSFISAFGQVALTFLLVMGMGRGFLGALAALAFAEFIAVVHLMIVGRISKYISLRELSFRRIKELLAYSWPMVPNSLSQWVMHTSDRLLITGVMGSVSNAIFAVAYKIPSILTFAQTTFNMAWQENASVVSKDDDAEAYYSSMFSKLFDISAGCLAMLVGFTPILFSIFVRGDYDASYIHIPFLYMGMFFFTLSTFWGGIFVAFKKTGIVGTTTVIAAVVHLVLAVLLIRPLGIFAASIATVVSYLCLCIVRWYCSRRVVSVRYNWTRVGIITLVLIGLCALCPLRNTAVMIFNLVFGTVFCIVLNRELIATVWRKALSIIKK